MKLYYAATSPYVRKVMACAITRGLEGRIQLHPCNPHASPADLVADNPTSKVPCRGEQQRPKEAARDAAIARYKAAMFRTVDALEADPPHRHIDIGSLAVACALGYLDFRYAADPWRTGRPKLTAWFEEFSQNPGIAQSAPKE